MAPPSSHSQSVLPGRNVLVLESISDEKTRFILNVRCEQQARCPECQRISRSCHSRYLRTLQDLPWQGRRVYLRVTVRRFRCRNGRCARKIFTEHLPDIVRQYARRTDRLSEIVRVVGYAAGGLPGSRLLNRLAIAISDDTVLRAVTRPPHPVLASEPIRHLGIDDWAWKKGQHYGTILVDLDRHRVVDLLPGRSADELRRWLQQHANLEVIARDRCGIYAEGAAAGAPDAIQVADRFHLVVNLSDAVERVLEGCSAQLSLTEAPTTSPSESPAKPEHPPTQQQIKSRQRRQRRLERYEQVVELNRSGYSQRAIADTLHMQRKTVRRWLRADGFPERKTPIKAPPKVEEHGEYLQQRWNEGCHNATTLFREVRARGYKGGRSMVARYVSGWRKKAKPERRKAPKRIAPRHAAMLACKPADRLSEQQLMLYNQLVASCPTLGLMRVLAEEFRQALFGNDASQMHDWIHSAMQSGIGPLIRFGYGLRKDLAAVTAAIETGWTSGQVEGQINRLKTIKRQMYGRAGFNLLRSRVLALPPSASP
jgi:transposase